MNICVVGAGLAGLATALHLSPHCQVMLFDGGHSASSISTGLLHPFPGKIAPKSWLGTEGMEATQRLLQIAEEALGKPLAERTGVLRIAVDEAQKKAFEQRAKEYPEAIWWSEKEVLSMVPNAISAPGLWIPSGMAVYSAPYLQGLSQACQNRGVVIKKQTIQSLDELADFDQVVLATGHHTLAFFEEARIAFESVKGQLLLCRWPKKLACSLTSSGHITPHKIQLCAKLDLPTNITTPISIPTIRSSRSLKRKSPPFILPCSSSKFYLLKQGFVSAAKKDIGHCS